MLTPQKIEWINFAATNVTEFGSNVYPEFSDVERNANVFCVVEVYVLGSERMITGTMYHGYVRLTFVGPDPRTLDPLIDKLGNALELKGDQFVNLTYGGVNNVSKPEKYSEEKEDLIKREIDLAMTWYRSIN